MSGMSTHTDTGACAMRESTLRLVVDTDSQIAQPHPSANRSNVVGVKSDSLEVLEIDDHTPILSAQTEGSIRMPTAPWLHFHIALGCAQHSI